MKFKSLHIELRRKLHVVMLEMIRNLNNEAVFLSNQCNDAIKAIEYLQQALIICKDLEMSRPISSFSSARRRTKRKIDLHGISGKEESRGSPTSFQQIPQVSGSTSPTYHGGPQRLQACTIAIIPANVQCQKKLESILCTMPFTIIEAILCFNLGICYLKCEEAEEAQMYFDRTGVVLSQFNSMYSKTSQMDFEFELSLDEFLRYFKNGSFTIEKFAPAIEIQKSVSMKRKVL